MDYIVRVKFSFDDQEIKVSDGLLGNYTVQSIREDEENRAIEIFYKHNTDKKQNFMRRYVGYPYMAVYRDQ